MVGNNMGVSILVIEEPKNALHEKMLEDIIKELESHNPGRTFKAEYVGGKEEVSKMRGLPYDIYEIKEKKFLRVSRQERKDIAHLENRADAYSAFVYDHSALEIIKRHVQEYCNACRKKPLFLKM